MTCTERTRTGSTLTAVMLAAQLLSYATGCRRADASAIAVQELVESWYPLAEGREVRVLDVKADGSLYRVTFHRAGPQPQLETIFVTRDGRYLVEALRPVQQESARLRDERRFAECLRDAGLRIYTQAAAPFSQQAVAQAGHFGDLVAIDCSSAAENCHKLGVTELPSITHGGEVFSGVKPRAWLESRTGCK